MNVTPEGWAWLGGSILFALLVDYAVTRLMLEWLKPAAVWLFWAGRAGKMAGLVAWIGFFNSFWYPRFAGGPVPDTIRTTEIVVAVLLLVLALVTIPRSLLPRRGSNE